jgi:hypothetical protein
MFNEEMDEELREALRAELAHAFRGAADVLDGPQSVDSAKEPASNGTSKDIGIGWLTYELPDLVGAKEACEILGVQKMTLGRWLRPGSGPFPPHGTYMIEPKRVDAGPIWVKSDMERFAQEVGRQRAPARGRG